MSKKNQFVTLIKIFSLILILITSMNAQQKYSSRDEIPEKYKWNFNDIYTSWDEWQKGFNDLEKMMDEVASLKGTLSKSPENLLSALKLQDEMNILSYKVYRYPQLMRDTDTRDQEVSSKLQQVQILFSKFGTATSWINPELLQIPWDTMKEWISNPDFAAYKFNLEDLFRQQKHVLDEDKETILSYFSQANSSPGNIYTEISTTDIKFPTVKLSTGEEIKMTSGNYSLTLATNENQEDRKLAFESHYNVYKEYENTYASIYTGVCQRDWANAQARNYTSSLHATLDGNNIPVNVYENLVSTVKANTEPLKKYNLLRKKVLGLEKYHTYDGSISLFESDKTYDYEEASKMVIESVAPLGKEYQSKLEKALSGGWLDVYETDGKRSGAYSANVYGVHPYMLLNYNGTLRSVFTLGHELGHTIHTVLANENQPFSTASYTIFVAEVASTFNEALLLDYLMSKTDDPKVRASLLKQAIDNLTGSFYFQSLLADFELQVHKLVEDGKPVTAKVLNGIMEDLYNAYYGDSMEKDELINSVWARIPHMYRTPFYVYQYATCFASSAQLYKSITTGTESEKESAKEKYLNLLKSGGSDYPMELLKTAGVDLSKPETINAVVEQMNDLVSRLEEELKKIK